MGLFLKGTAGMMLAKVKRILAEAKQAARAGNLPLVETKMAELEQILQTIEAIVKE